MTAYRGIVAYNGVVGRAMLVGIAVGLMGTGCTIGFGSSYVGQWRAHDKLEFEVCIERPDGTCEANEPVMRHVPARRYWGVSVLIPAFGPSFISVGDNDGTVIRGGALFEVLKGNGRYALGIRSGLLITNGAEENDTTLLTSIPVTGIGHIGLSERFSVYGGLGYIPYADLHYVPASGAAATDQTSSLGGQLLVGMNIVNSRSLSEFRTLWTLEIERTWVHFDKLDHHATSIVAAFGFSL